MDSSETKSSEQAVTILRIPAKFFEQMQKHVHMELPLEACGILGGIVEGQTIHAVTLFPMENSLNSRVRYRMHPVQQFQVFKELESSNQEMVAIYHSHPSGPNTPSIVDVQEAYYPEAVYLIWSSLTGEWRLYGYQIRYGKFREILIELNKKF